MRRLGEGTSLRLLFLAACVICAVTTGVLSVVLIRKSDSTAEQARISCNATNRALEVESKIWTLIRQRIVTTWIKTPPSAEERAQTIAFFDTVTKLIHPAKC